MPTARAEVVRWPWPVPVRVLAGAAAGWLSVDGLQRSAGPDWRVWAAMGGLALAALAAPSTDAWAGRGITSGIALVTVLGLWLGPPETGQTLALALGLLVLWVAELTGRAYVDGLVVMLLSLLIVWAAVWGAASRPGAIIGGIAMLGLFVVAPVARGLPGPRQGLGRPWEGPALVLLQLLYVVGIGRTAALSSSRVDAAAIVVGALVLLTIVARLIIGSSDEKRSRG